MRFHSYLTCMLVLLFFVTLASAQKGSYLDPGSLAIANQDINETMSKESLFNPSQDSMGNATPVITGKNTPAATVNTNPSQPKARLTNPSIRWHLDLRDDVDRSVDLDMSQSGDAVFGTGSISAEGLNHDVTATGAFSTGKLSLDILSVDDLTLYRFDLTRQGKTFFGDYHALSASLQPWTGTAMGSIQI